MYHDLCVREMIYDDLDTLEQFMTFLASQVDQIERVRIYSPDPALHLMFTNPDSGENRAHDGYIHEIDRRTMGNMIRLFDVAQYFAVQTHTCAPVSRPFVLGVSISDSFLPHNARTYLLRIQDKTVTLLTADISDFSSFVIGAVSLSELLRLGRVQLSNPSFARDGRTRLDGMKSRATTPIFNRIISYW